MFFCDACAKERGWPQSMFKSKGPCEMCGKVAVCNDVKSSALPLPKKEEEDGP